MSFDFEELKKSLGLNEKPKLQKEKDTRFVVHKEVKKKAANVEDIADSCLRLDQWDRAIGQELHAQDSRLSELAWSDFHTMLYVSAPSLHEHCISMERQQFIKDMMETPTYKSIRLSTLYNRPAAEAAAKKIADQYIQLKGEDDNGGDEDQKREEGGNENDLLSEMESARRASEALAEAGQEVQRLEEGLAALGLRSGGSGAGKKRSVHKPLEMNPAEITRLFSKIKNNPILRRICELAGRYRLMARSNQRKKMGHGMDEMTGIELSGKFSRLLSKEKAMFAHPKLKMEAIRKLMAKQSMSRQFKGIEKVGKGPIVVWADESASMNGREKFFHAKAFALAMAWIARFQKRWCCLGGFAVSGERTFITLPPDKWNEDELCAWLIHNFDGGTDIPLLEHEDIWRRIKPPQGKTDIIYITDGSDTFSAEDIELFRKWKKKNQVKAYSIILHDKAGDLGKISDQLWLHPTLSPETPGVSECLSI